MIIPALAGWCFFDYPAAIHLLNDPLAVSPNNGCGNPFRRSESSAQGYIPYRRAEDFDPAIALAPESRGVRVIVADAYTYGNVPGPQPAFAESILRVRRSSKHATCSRHFASAYLPLGNQLAAAAELRTDIELVTTQLAQAAPLLPAPRSHSLGPAAQLRNSRSCHGRGGALDPGAAAILMTRFWSC